MSLFDTCTADRNERIRESHDCSKFRGPETDSSSGSYFLNPSRQSDFVLAQFNLPGTLGVASVPESNCFLATSYDAGESKWRRQIDVRF